MAREKENNKSKDKNETKNKAKDTAKDKTKDKAKTKVKTLNTTTALLITLGWVLFVLFVFVFYFYFRNEIKLDKKTGEKTTIEKTEDTGITTEINEEFISKYIYETNSNMEINMLVNDYFTALTTCNQETLKVLVKEPSQFDDMTEYIERSKVISGYENVNCYTLEGEAEDVIICYAISNITLEGIESHPLDITLLYIVSDDNGYKIDNGTVSESRAKYIEELNLHADIQELYQSVQNNINMCIQNDPSFAEFYEKINSY